METVLITGASGFLGSSVIRMLQNKSNYNVIAVVSERNNSNYNWGGFN